MTDRGSDILAACAAGRLDPALALMQLLLALPEAPARDALGQALATATGAPHARLAQMDRLWLETPEAFQLLTAVAGTATPETRDIGAWAAIFDKVARASPEASVALYSLGRADLLAAATQELIDFLTASGVLRSDTRVLDLGCGIGRIVTALAPRVAHVTGVDISGQMIAAARERTRATNVTYVHGNGQDLSFAASQDFDLVLAVDVFPYLVAAGPDVVGANMGEIARVMAPGARLLLFNFSYRGDDARDLADVRAAAGSAGLHFRETARPLRRWDGRLFDLGKPLSVSLARTADPAPAPHR